MIHTKEKRKRYAGIARIAVLWMTAGLVLLCGCGSGDSVIYQIADESTADSGAAADVTENSGDSKAEKTSSVSSGSGKAADDRTDGQTAEIVASDSGPDDSGAQGDADGSARTESGAEDAASDAGSERAGEQSSILYVYVCGAVTSPGVYQLPAGSRIYQAIDAADGLTEDAETCCLNQAELLTDGQQVTVYTKEEAETLGLKGKQASAPASGDASQSVSGTGADGNAGQADSKVNLNTATKEQLMTLPGIGESRAEAIIEYRTSSGGFSCIEDIQNISGIKEKAFAKIKDYIEV